MATQVGDPVEAGQVALVLHRRRSLPGGRAVTGAFLVAAASVGLFVSYVQATSRPGIRYVVARHAVATGQAVTAGDLTVVALDLGPPAVSGHAFRDPAAVVGRVALAPLSAGELIQDAGLAARGRSDGGRHVAVPVDATQADGIQPGSWVDVLVTRASGGESHTDVVALNVRLLTVDHPRSSLGVTSAPVAQLDVPTFDAVKALVQAAHDGPLTLVPSSAPPAGTGP